MQPFLAACYFALDDDLVVSWITKVFAAALSNVDYVVKDIYLVLRDCNSFVVPLEVLN